MTDFCAGRGLTTESKWEWVQVESTAGNMLFRIYIKTRKFQNILRVVIRNFTRIRNPTGPQEGVISPKPTNRLGRSNPVRFGLPLRAVTIVGSVPPPQRPANTTKAPDLTCLHVSRYPAPFHPRTTLRNELVGFNH